MIDPPEFEDETSLPVHQPACLTTAASLFQVRLTDVDLGACRAADVELEQVIFHKIRASASACPGLRCTDFKMTRCDASNAKWDHARWRRCIAEDCKLTGANLSSSTFEHVLFDRCRLDFAAFQETHFSSCVFRDCHLQQANFENADARGVVFESCQLQETRFVNTRLAGADLRGSNLVDLEGTADDIRGIIVDAAQLIELAPLFGVEVR
jgi:uncharacterized protein YjbI with pentapeptide repeats